MARCESCNKFVGFDDPEFEVNSEDVSQDGARTLRVTFDVEVKRNCSDCGTTLRTGQFDVEHIVELPEGEPDLTENDELALDLDDPEENTRTEGKGRGLKTFIGFSIHGTVTVTRPKPEGASEDTEEKTLELSFDAADEMQASHFDEA